MARVLMACLPWPKPGSKYQAREGMRWSHTSDKEPVVSFRAFPFYLGYASAVIRDHGHEIKVIDCLAEKTSVDDFLLLVREFSPDFMVSEMSSPSYSSDCLMFKKVKEASPRTKLVAAGQHPTALPEEVIKENEGIIDHVLVGEYDFTANDLVSGKTTDKIIKSPENVELDTIPWPARELFNIKLYNETFCDEYPNANMLFSRGCPYRCNYCNIYLMSHNRKIRYRSPKDTAKEMKFLVDTYKMKELYFDDDNITVLQPRLVELCHEIKNAELGIPWKAMGHVSVKKETLDLMRSVGCNGMKFGVEVADDEILRRLGKGITVKMVEDTVNHCKKIGIKTHLTFCLGLPGETEETMLKTIEFAQKYGDSFQMSMAAPFPGTPLYEEAKANGWLKMDSWDDLNGLNRAIIDYPDLSGEVIYTMFSDGIKGSYLKAFKGKEPIKFLKMIYKESGVRGLMRLMRRRDIVTGAIQTKKKYKV
ncbi:radical SAM protein [Candidatus Woesearchaeota archaeon]|nr:radical SAM protein [Candidatus Woesearchaeota archaeon]HIH37498.1 radical SAM protein [Candidatus Woesearchaeota archaeon]HIJ03247.1 radical SAM protein [Candidatus Woesearchaeota archaeon]